MAAKREQNGGASGDGELRRVQAELGAAREELREFQAAQEGTNKKIGAILTALDQSAGDTEKIERFVFARSRPKYVFGGDFWWARRFDDRLCLVVGDATGHDSYSAMLRTIAVLALEKLAPTSQGRAPKSLKTARSLLEAAGTHFSEILNIALRSEEVADLRMDRDGFSAASIVITRTHVDISAFGIPVFHLPNKPNKPIETIGSFVSLGKTICSGGLDQDELEKSESRLPRKKNSMLLICTDGIVEQMNENGNALEQRGLLRVLDDFRQSPQWDLTDRALHLAERVIAATRDHRGEVKPSDDRLVVALDLARIGDSS